MLENINLGIEFTGHNIDPVVPSPEFIGAQTGDITFTIIATLVLLAAISLFLLGIRKLPLLNTTTQGLHVRIDSKSNQNLKPIFSAVFAAILALMLICSCCLATKAFAGNNEANIDVTPDKIQVVVDGDTGTIQEAVFNFENTSDNYYLFDKTTSMSLTPEAAAITQAADWDIQLTALETDLFSGTPDGSDYSVPGDVITLMPHTSAQAVLKFNKCDFETAKKLVGIQVFTLTMIPDQHVVGVPSAVEGLVYNGEIQQGVPSTYAYNVINGAKENADSYTAQVILNSGYKWPDKSTASKTIPWSIAPLPVSLSWDTPILTYTGEAQHPTATVTNIKGSDVVTAATYSYPEGYDGTSAKEQKVNVATLSGASASNYTLEGATGAEKTYTISKKALTITADDKQKMEGAEKDPELTATFDGLVHEETFILEDDYTITRQTAIEEHAGDTFDITVAVLQGSQVAENYSITTKKGTLTIVPKNPVITPEAKSKTYGIAIDPSLTATVENADEGFPLVIGTDYTLSREAGENAGEYKITVTLKETEHVRHYEKIDCKDGTFTINKRAAQFKWEGGPFTYNKNRQHPTATITNKVLEDDVNVDQYIGVDSNMRSAGTQKCKVFSLSGESANNYSLDDITNFKQYTINKADIAMDLSVNGESITQPRNYQDVTLEHTLSITFGPDSPLLMELSYQWYEAASYEGQQTEISGATEGTYNILKDSYVGQKYYFLKVTINPHDDNFNITSKTSTNEKYVKFVYTAMSFNDQLTNTTTTLYTKYATNLLYKGETSEETGTIPTPSKEGYTFGGWYTETSGGIQVVNDENVIVPGQTIEGYISSGSWVNTVEKTLYAHLYKAQYLTFTNTAEGDNTIKFTQNVQAFNNAPSLILRYSTDLVKWDVLNTSGATEQILATLNNSDKTKLYVAGYNPEGFSTATRIDSFSSTDKFSVDGNYMALIDYTRDDLKAIPNDYCFQQLFKDCSNLTSVPKLDFTFDKENQSHCLNQMFQNCSLINYLEVTFTQWPTNGFSNWVSGVAGTGTFICPKSLEWKCSGGNFCPREFHNEKGEARVYFEGQKYEAAFIATSMHFYTAGEEDHDDYAVVRLDNDDQQNAYRLKSGQLVSLGHVKAVTQTNLFKEWTENLRSLKAFFWSCASEYSSAAELKTLNLSYWNVSNVTDCSYCFFHCLMADKDAGYELNLKGWNLSKAKYIHFMFCGCEVSNILVDLANDLSQITEENMFLSCVNLPNYDESAIDSSKAKNRLYGGYFTYEHQGMMNIDGNGKATFYTFRDTSYTFENPILVHPENKTWTSSSIKSVEITDNFKNYWMPWVTSTHEWFDGSKITSINFAFDGKRLQNAKYMFRNCENLNAIDLSINNNSVLEDCSSMFSGCPLLTAASGKIPFSNIKDCSMMFWGCACLVSVFDSQNWKLNKVERADMMFASCSNLIALDVSEWFDASGTYPSNISCAGMFNGCSSLQTLACKANTNWSTIITTSGGMFTDCSSLPRYSASNVNDATWAKPWDGAAGYFTIKS